MEGVTFSMGGIWKGKALDLGLEETPRIKFIEYHPPLLKERKIYQKLKLYAYNLVNAVHGSY